MTHARSRFTTLALVYDKFKVALMHSYTRILPNAIEHIRCMQALKAAGMVLPKYYVTARHGVSLLLSLMPSSLTNRDARHRRGQCRP